MRKSRNDLIQEIMEIDDGMTVCLSDLERMDRDELNETLEQVNYEKEEGLREEEDFFREIDLDSTNFDQ